MDLVPTVLVSAFEKKYHIQPMSLHKDNQANEKYKNTCTRKDTRAKLTKCRVLDDDQN